MQFEDRETVYFDGRPYVIIRVDSAGTSAELYPGDIVTGVKIKNADRGHWVSTSRLTKRNPDAASPVEKVLGEIWMRFRADDWEGAQEALEAFAAEVRQVTSDKEG